MARYCASCGTEVDETAVFCPTCGQPIDDRAAGEMPRAPAWPDAAEVRDEPERPAADDREPVRDTAPEPEPEPEPAPEPGLAEAPTRIEQRPSPVGDPDHGAVQPPAAAPPRADVDRADQAPEARREPGSPQVELPFTMPVTLSGWLIGVGAVLAVLGLIVILIGTALNAIDLLLLIALLAVAATVFLSAHLPAVPHLRLLTLVIALIAFGVALDRIGFRGGGAGELLLFLGTAAAAIGAVILELGQDQPLGGPQR